MRELGVELCYIVDADEFYHEGSLERIQRLAGDAPSRDRVYWARGRHLFRGFDYLVSGGPAQLLPVALHVAPGSKFINCRVPSGVREDLPHDLFYWHTGYVGTDQRMWEKVNTFGHAHELAPGWFEEKWKAWTPETTDLCRKRPERWPRTEQIDPRRLPAVLRSHRFHAMALQCRIPR